MPPLNLRPVQAAFVAVAAIVFVWLFAPSYNPRARVPVTPTSATIPLRIGTGQLLLCTQVTARFPSAIANTLTLQSGVYEECSYAWLQGFLPHYAAMLKEAGLGQWSPSFDCLWRALAFRVEAQREYAVWSADHPFAIQAQSLTIVQISLIRDTDAADARAHGWDGRMGSKGGPAGHAILAILTDKGLVLVDPSMAEPITTLSNEEIESIYAALG